MTTTNNLPSTSDQAHHPKSNKSSHPSNSFTSQELIEKINSPQLSVELQALETSDHSDENLSSILNSLDVANHLAHSIESRLDLLLVQLESITAQLDPLPDNQSSTEPVQVDTTQQHLSDYTTTNRSDPHKNN
ncbi:hypothetical protein CROQUDRAFT_651896 [Cronartium quercuum f. sp. fusiforme G11]|uniref:Uncharacterized protein n=1 Tax=Cronartium quercuum f. sp. fusiforme G11 TaxID=708437 RepID=A0A9P6TG75_9BASI|nr:hypothetical protein CROQUDRAFT_651896 [Cronartium quercuum f. sp. fusiforme G11]